MAMIENWHRLLHVSSSLQFNLAKMTKTRQWHHKRALATSWTLLYYSSFFCTLGGRQFSGCCGAVELQVLDVGLPWWPSPSCVRLLLTESSWTAWRNSVFQWLTFVFVTPKAELRTFTRAVLFVSTNWVWVQSRTDLMQLMTSEFKVLLLYPWGKTVFLLLFQFIGSLIWRKGVKRNSFSLPRAGLHGTVFQIQSSHELMVLDWFVCNAQPQPLQEHTSRLPVLASSERTSSCPRRFFQPKPGGSITWSLVLLVLVQSAVMKLWLCFHGPMCRTKT